MFSLSDKNAYGLSTTYNEPRRGDIAQTWVWTHGQNGAEMAEPCKGGTIIMVVVLCRPVGALLVGAIKQTGAYAPAYIISPLRGLFTFDLFIVAPNL